jgi:hypothetical protein
MERRKCGPCGGSRNGWLGKDRRLHIGLGSGADWLSDPRRNALPEPGLRFSGLRGLPPR